MLPAVTRAASGCRPDEAPVNNRPPSRLRKRAQFLAVRAGEKRRGRLFLVEALTRGDGGEARLGLTVSRKVGNAVVRVTLLVVAPAAIVPTKPNEGTKPIVAPAPNVPASAGDWTKFQAFVTKLKRFRTVADAN